MIRTNPIRYHRECAGLTQGDIASQMNLDKSTVAKWETGVALPRASILPELARILGCTIDDLFEKEQP